MRCEEFEEIQDRRVERKFPALSTLRFKSKQYKRAALAQQA
ncbi:MAG: hypothetical protein WC222_04030 [Parachlamydiales bacterium]|jgi:hypothetical protein